MYAADEAGVVGFVADRFDTHFEAAGFEYDGRPADRELADAALPQSAAHGDPLDILPILQAQEAADHLREFL